MPNPVGRAKGVDSSYCKPVESGGYFEMSPFYRYYYPTVYQAVGDDGFLWFKYDDSYKIIYSPTVK